jgi:hypothetical protein
MTTSNSRTRGQTSGFRESITSFASFGPEP